MPPLRRVIPLLTLGAALAAVPSAMADVYEVHATARGSHGFKVQLRAGTVTDYGGQSVFIDPGSVVVSRSARNQTISRTLRGGQPIKVTAAKKLKQARVRLGFGSRGSIDLRFTPTGKLRKMGTDNCGEDALHGRRGVFHGKFDLQLGGVFKTLHRTRLQGTISSGGDGADCSDPAPIGGDDHLSVSGGGVSGIFYRVAQPMIGPATGFGMVTRPQVRGKHWTESDEIELRGKKVFHDDAPPTGGGVTLTASARVQAGGPYLSGSLDYGPQPGIVRSQEGTFVAPGPVAGLLTARFDELGGAAATLSPTTGTLISECEQCI